MLSTKDVIQYLNQHGNVQAIEDMAAFFSVTPRTIRNHLRSVQDAYPACLQVGRGQVKLLKQIPEESSPSAQVPSSQQERSRYILRALLSRSEPMDLDELAASLFISEVTLQNEVKLIRHEIAEYHLSLRTKNNTLFISGSEKDKKRLMIHLIYNEAQHTLVTRKSMNGGADLPIICKVYTGLTKEEEAILFSKQTGVSRPLTAGAELRAALVGKDAESIAFLNATESTGLQLGLDSYRAPWKIICIRTAFKEYKAYGADLYKEALTMLAKGWEGDPDSLRSGILQGMVRFVALYQGEYDPERLVKRLQTIHPMTLVRDEKSLSGTVSYKYMMLILRTYNGSSRRFNLPIKQ